MSDYRTSVNAEAQRAFRTMLDHYCRTGEWSASLVDAYTAAERDVDYAPEWLLDAQHDAVQAEMDELADAESSRLPDVPLAYRAPLAESELRALWGDR